MDGGGLDGVARWWMEGWMGGGADAGLAGGWQALDGGDRWMKGSRAWMVVGG